MAELLGEQDKVLERKRDENRVKKVSIFHAGVTYMYVAKYYRIQSNRTEHQDLLGTPSA